MAKIKLATMNDVPRFQHNGLSVINSWQEIDTDTLTDESRQALVDYVGRFVRVHDEDADAFKQYMSQHGYEYQDGKLTDTRSPEERQRERDAAAATATATGTARGTSPGRPPVPPREDTAGNFQVPPGSESGLARETEQAARDREASPTSPDKPSNKPRPR